MHPFIVVLSGLALASPLSAAPILNPHARRTPDFAEDLFVYSRLIMDELKYAKKPVVDAFKIAASRVVPSLRHALSDAIESIAQRGLNQISIEEAQTLIVASEKGDVRAIEALNHAVSQHYNTLNDVVLNPAAAEVLVHYPLIAQGDGKYLVGQKFKPNGIHLGIVDTKEYASGLKYGAELVLRKLTRRQRQQLIALGLIATTGVTLAVALNLALPATGAEYLFPKELNDDEMKKLIAYVSSHPEEYEVLMAEVNARIPNITEAQKQTLKAAEPEDGTTGVTSSGDSKRSLDDLD